MDHPLVVIVAARDQPAVSLLAVPHRGAYWKIGSAFAELGRRAAAHGLTPAQGLPAYGLYFDDPRAVPEDQLRSAAALTAPAGFTPVEGAPTLEALALPGGLCAVGLAEVLPPQFPEAWDQVFASMAQHGYAGDDRVPFEVYLNNCADHPEGRFVVEICVPVRPA